MRRSRAEPFIRAPARKPFSIAIRAFSSSSPKVFIMNSISELVEDFPEALVDFRLPFGCPVTEVLELSVVLSDFSGEALGFLFIVVSPFLKILLVKDIVLDFLFIYSGQSLIGVYQQLIQVVLG
jgi:hypothetical protein